MSETQPPQKPPVEMRISHKTDAQLEKENQELARQIKAKDPEAYKKYIEPELKRIEDAKRGITTVIVGQVRMKFPDTWKPGLVRKNAIGNDSYEDYKINGDKDATISFYYRGMRTAEDEGEDFLKVLKAPPHDLSDMEFWRIKSTLRRANDDFTKTVLRTVDLNGKRVLLLEGNIYKGKPNEEYVRSIYIDSDGTGTAVQEVFFQASPKKYKEHLKEAEAAFNSISWK